MMQILAPEEAKAKLKCEDLPTTHEGEVRRTKGDLVLGELWVLPVASNSDTCNPADFS